MLNHPFQGGQLRPLKRKDWPVFHDDTLILKKFPWETFCGLSHKQQVQAEMAVMGILWGDPYLRCPTIIRSILYEENTGDPTYGLNLMYKCWKMGAFEPCRLYLEDRQEIFDLESSDEEQYEACGSEEQEYDWIGKFKQLQLGNVAKVERGLNHLGNKQEAQMQTSSDDSYSSSGSSNIPIPNSKVVRERSSSLATNARGAAKKTTAITPQGERSFSQQKRANDVQAMIPKGDMNISDASKRVNDRSQNTRIHERPILSASGTSASKSSSGSHTPQVDKSFVSAPVQYTKTFEKDSAIRHPVVKYEEHESSVPNQVSKIPSTPASRAQKAYKHTLSSSPSSRSPNTSIKEENYEATNREAIHRKASISVTSNNSAVTAHSDRRTKPISVPVHSTRASSQTNSNLGHSTFEQSTSKDVDKKPNPAALRVDKFEESDLTSPIGIRSPKPGNSSRDLPKQERSCLALGDHEQLVVIGCEVSRRIDVTSNSVGWKMDQNDVFE